MPADVGPLNTLETSIFNQLGLLAGVFSRRGAAGGNSTSSKTQRRQVQHRLAARHKLYTTPKGGSTPTGAVSIYSSATYPEPAWRRGFSAPRALRVPSILRYRRPNPRGWTSGIEPPTSGTTIRRSNRLSYAHHGLCAPDPLVGRENRSSNARYGARQRKQSLTDGKPDPRRISSASRRFHGSENRAASASRGSGDWRATGPEVRPDSRP